MAKHRTKSADQIWKQAQRIQNTVDERALETKDPNKKDILYNRGDKAWEIANRYRKNIGHTKSYWNTFFKEDYDKAENKQYSRNTYMGLNEG